MQVNVGSRDPDPERKRRASGQTKPRESEVMVKLQRVYARMTWLGEAMKDGVSTDMSRGVANRL